MQAIIFAAGFGTRLGALIRDRAKAWLEVGGKTLLAHNIQYLAKYGVRRVIVNVHYKAEQIIDYLHKHQGFGLEYRIVWENTSRPLETGGGLANARIMFEQEDFITINADILTDVDLSLMYAAHKSQGNLISLLVGERKGNRGLYFDSQHKLVGWGNRDSGEFRGMQGRYFWPFWGITICNFALLAKAQHFSQTKPVYSLLDLWLALITQGEKIAAYVVEPQLNQRFCDVGTPEKLADAQNLFA